MLHRILALALVLNTGLAVSAADWPQFRGPNGSGVSTEQNLPTQFTEKEGVRWKAELPAR